MHIICVVHVYVCIVGYMLCVPCMFVWHSVLCDQEHTFPPLRCMDMALLSVSQLTCGTCMVHRVEYCVDIVLADSAHCV